MTETTAPRHLLHAFPSFQLGGAQARFIELANALGPGFRHTIVAMDNCFDAGERLQPQVRWTAQPLPVVKGGALANRGAFRQVLRQLQPDLLLSHNWGSIEWAAANLPRLCPQLHIEDGFGPDEARQQLPRRVWTRHALLGWGRVPLVVISRQLEHLALQAWRLPRQRVHFIANGVALPDTAPAPVPAAGAVLRIGTLAGLRPEKNIARLVRAFAHLRRTHAARLVIVGGGPLLPDLQQLAQQLGVAQDVEFTGYLRQPGVQLQTFDLFALSSDTEQLPIAMLEAMALGLPVLATAVGDVPTILAPVAPGNHCPPDDDAFAQLLRQVVQARAQWPTWGALGREQVRRHYAKADMLAQWQAVWAGQARHSFTP